MPDQLLSRLQDWIKSNSTNPSIVNLLESFGYENIIWVMLSPNRENYLLDHSKSVDRDFLIKFQESNNFEQIKGWMQDALQDQIIKVGDLDRVILYLHKDQYSNISMIICDHQENNVNLSNIRILTRIAVEMINKTQKLQTLENALRLGYSQSEQIIDPALSKLTLNSLKPSFINDVVPHVFYSYVHEDYGPVIFEAIPETMNDPDYIITAVKLFSGLEAEMVASVGHVFKTDPISKPVMGEIFSVVFTLPNDEARGKFEIHSISVIIPQEFTNLSKSLIGEFKTQLFMAVEKLRYTHEEKDWGIAVDQFGSSEHLKKEIYVVIEEVRQQLALSYAILMNTDDVLNW